MSLSTGDTKDNLASAKMSVYAALKLSGHSNPVVIDAEDKDIEAAAVSHHLQVFSA